MRGIALVTLAPGLAAGSCIAAGVATLAILAAMGVAIWISGSLAGTGISAGLTAGGVLGVWPVAMLFAGVAMLAAGLLHRAAPVTGLAMGTLVAMYGLDLAGRLAHAVDWLRWASVFRYAGTPMRDGLDPVAVAAITAVAIVLMAASAWAFTRRDILH